MVPQEIEGFTLSMKRRNNRGARTEVFTFLRAATKLVYRFVGHRNPRDSNKSAYQKNQTRGATSSLRERSELARTTAREILAAHSITLILRFTDRITLFNQ